MARKSVPPSLATGDLVTKWPGVGDSRAREFGNLGISTFEDLLGLWPRRHEDRSVITPIAQLQHGESATVRGVIDRARYDFARQMLRVEMLEDSSRLIATFFHASWLQKQFAPGRQVMLSGKVEGRGRAFFMAHPEFQILSPDEQPLLGLIPIYPLSGSLKQLFMQRLMREVVSRFAVQVDDPVPVDIQRREKLEGRPLAVLHQHFPADTAMLEMSRKRLVFDEFFRIAMAVLMMHRLEPGLPGLVHDPDGPLTRAFLKSLPFRLTAAQYRVWKEISTDLASARPMARLLQGDVGSGKTVVAILAMLAAVDGGHQAAFMAPTELLAEQQAQVLRRFLNPLGMEVALLTGKDKHAKSWRLALQDGTLSLVVGTQALIADRVGFSRLGVVIVDEQHRFGVKQRATLSLKGSYPDMLVMTATPIPRTLALTVYGDLEISEIDEMPPGRKLVMTEHISHAERKLAYSAVMAAVKRGEQAYVVCPLVEGDDGEGDVKAAVDLAQGMAKLPGWRIGLLHGRMPSQEKTREMDKFRRHDVDVLVCTTIVEVGVDVPAATIMVIEDADHFGLAQLHQLRGRVGRGDAQSFCYLIADPKTEQAQERLAAMVRYHEGIKLAEEDLRIRGPGEVLGMRQHGVTGFQLANPQKDLELLQRARAAARQIFDEDPHMTSPEHEHLWAWVREALDDAIPAQVLH